MALNKDTLNVFSILKKYNTGEKALDFSYQLDVINHFTSDKLPVKLIILAFPGKSINEDSVISKDLDLGDIIALTTLQNLCKEINHKYSPGCVLTIVHDGHFFYRTGCMRPFEELESYINQLQEVTDDTCICHKTIKDYLSGESYDTLLDKFISTYCPSREYLRSLVISDQATCSKFLAECLFVKNEFSFIYSQLNNSCEKKKRIKELAYQLLSYESGLQKLVLEKHPQDLRLSIHIQNTYASKKFYIKLIPNCVNLSTPWFNTLVKDSNELTMLIKKKAALNNGYTLSDLNGYKYYKAKENLTPSDQK